MKYLDVALHGGRVRVEAWLDVRDARALLGLDEAGGSDEVLARREALGALLSAKIRVRGTSPCVLSMLDATEDARDGHVFVRAKLRARCRTFSTIELTDQTVFETDPQHEAFVYWEGHEAAILRRGRQSVRLTSSQGVVQALARGIAVGAHALATGYAHLLFLLALLLPFGRTHGPAGAREVARASGAFALGLCGGVACAYAVPRTPVTAWLVAASIVLVACLRVARPLARERSDALALVFGIPHGLLALSGLSERPKVIDCIGSAIGLVAAQVAFTTLVVWTLRRARENPSYARVVVRGGGALVAALGLLWALESVR